MKESLCFSAIFKDLLLEINRKDIGDTVVRFGIIRSATVTLNLNYT
jgi:hypothetical protein